MSRKSDQQAYVEHSRTQRRKNKLKEEYKIMIEDFNEDESFWLQCYTSEKNNAKAVVDGFMSAVEFIHNDKENAPFLDLIEKLFSERFPLYVKKREQLKSHKKSKVKPRIIEEVIDLSDDEDEVAEIIPIEVVEDVPTIKPKILKWKMPKRIKRNSKVQKKSETDTRSVKTGQKVASEHSNSDRSAKSKPEDHSKPSTSQSKSQNSSKRETRSSSARSISPVDSNKKNQIKSNEVIRKTDPKSTKEINRESQNSLKKKPEISDKPSPSILCDEMCRKKTETKTDTTKISTFNELSNMVSDLFNSSDTSDTSDDLNKTSKSPEKVCKSSSSTTEKNSKSYEKIDEITNKSENTQNQKEAQIEKMFEEIHTEHVEISIEKSPPKPRKEIRQSTIKNFFKSTLTKSSSNSEKIVKNSAISNTGESQKSEGITNTSTLETPESISIDNQIDVHKVPEIIPPKKVVPKIIEQEPVDPDVPATIHHFNRTMSIRSTSTDSGVAVDQLTTAPKRSFDQVKSNANNAESVPKVQLKKIKIEPEYDSDATTEHGSETDDDAEMDEILKFTCNFVPNKSRIEANNNNNNDDDESQDINEHDESLSQNLIPYMPKTILPPEIKKESSP